MALERYLLALPRAIIQKRAEQMTSEDPGTFPIAGARDSRTHESFGAAMTLQTSDSISALVSYQADIDKDGLQNNRFTARTRYEF